MRNLLQEQLLKAGLAKKAKVDAAAREQAKQRQGKAPAAAGVEKVDVRRLQAERAERDRALAAERNARVQAHELRAQVRQIVEAGKVKGDGEIAYGFEDAGAIRRILVDAAQRSLLAKGALVVARLDDGYALLPRAAADKVCARDASMIVLDHGRTDQADAPAADEDPHYAQFKVPDDLVW